MKERLRREPASLGARLQDACDAAWGRYDASKRPSEPWFEEAQEELRARQREIDAYLKPSFDGLSENLEAIVEDFIGQVSAPRAGTPSQHFEIVAIEHTPLITCWSHVRNSVPFREFRIRAMKEGVDVVCEPSQLGATRNNQGPVELIRVSLVLP